MKIISKMELDTSDLQSLTKSIFDNYSKTTFFGLLSLQV